MAAARNRTTATLDDRLSTSERRWPKVRAQVEAGTLTRRQAAKKLHIGQATLKRLLDAPAAA